MSQPVHRAPRHRGAPANPLVDVPHKAARTTAKTTLLLSVLAIGGTSAAVASGVAFDEPNNTDALASAGQDVNGALPTLSADERAARDSDSVSRSSDREVTPRVPADRRELADPQKEASLGIMSATSQAVAGVEKVAPKVKKVVPTGDPQEIAKAMLGDFGWGDDQFGCLVSLWNKESGWRVDAENPSGAYGIPQSLPGSKMASAGSDWRTNPATQIKWGLGYIQDSYGSPCSAWAHSQADNWY
ncbi:MAG: lytic transglycosylase domain-containing protein [Nocardioides sp.]|nr:lytic transglycosylase domain-containing protein [Nocardioides sp.]